MSVLGKVIFVVNNLLALIRPGSVILSFANGSVIKNLGCFIGKNAMALILGGLLGNLYDNYTEEKKTGRLARDAIARLEDDVDQDTEIISLLKEAWKEAQEENLSLLHETDEKKKNEADLIQRNDDLSKELKKKVEEYEDALIRKEKEVDDLKKQLADKDQECERNREKLEELQSQASDNDFYCGYLEEKIKAHEAERKKLREMNTKLENQLRASQREVPVLLARNRDPEKNLGNEAQRNVHILEDRVQLLQRENEKLKEKLSEREQEMASVNNSTVSEKYKNDSLVEENEVLRDKMAEPADQDGTFQSEVAERKPEEIESGTSTTEKRQKKKKARRRGRR
ncbi:fibrinogen- and Ig-binding protein-like [Macrobrachium rosenbergii]|uniref:fibrinogen- and Ig-binding protein-like n=1 Tax=Macrobrachium rosenbergii TaxID=79674 RepID=UPI0034D5A37F